MFHVERRRKTTLKDIFFESTEWDSISELIEDYFTELGYNNDAFHNSMMTGGTPYTIFISNELSGFFSVADSWECGKMITSFYIHHKKRRYSADILDSVCSEYDIAAVLVASNDSHLISIAFEKMKALGTSFEMQAYNFTYGEPDVKAAYGMDYMEKVPDDEFDRMNELTEKQWEGCFDSDDFQFWKIVKNNITLGYGAICKMPYNRKNIDVGNFTLPEYRRKGVGRSMIINLSQIALNQGFTPVAGCWYYNKESIPTLKSSGYIPQNRIFYIRFK